MAVKFHKAVNAGKLDRSATSRPAAKRTIFYLSSEETQGHNADRLGPRTWNRYVFYDFSLQLPCKWHVVEEGLAASNMLANGGSQEGSRTIRWDEDCSRAEGV